MKNLATEVIKYSSNQIKSNRFENFFAYLFSFFSVIFSLSIIVELQKSVNGIVLYTLALFIVVFLVFTEYIKVVQLVKYFKKTNYNLFALVLTHLVSIFISCIGIYFFTNKTESLSNQISFDNQNKVNSIGLEYQSKKDSINNLSVQSNIEYINLNKSLDYWKSRKASTIEERTEIRNQIKQIESNLLSVNDKFDLYKTNQIKSINDLQKNELDLLSVNANIVKSDIDRNLFISSVLFGLMFLVKIIIIYMALNRANNELDNDKILSSEVANRFRLFYNALRYFYAMKGDNKVFYMNEFSKDIPMLVGKWDDETTYLIKFLTNHKIIKIDIAKGEKKGKILLSESEALQILSDSYNVLLQSK
jgi:hypothetical protein